jgi:protein-S-isoprenylcysteine O-methyltransferase Ste14
MNHLASPLYLGRFLPGQFTSPLLIGSGIWLIVQARRVEGRANSLSPVIGSIVFFLVAPMTVVGWIPYAISGWHFGPPVLGLDVTRAFGGVLVVSGAAGLVDSFVRFALQGRGTPAPIAPPADLVVTGLYRYARNPMYISVLSAIAGQALLFGDVELLNYSGIVWVLAHTFVVAYEERALRARFGRSYDAYRSHVPRWVPRLRPWIPPAELAAG